MGVGEGVFEKGSARSIPHMDDHGHFEQIISHVKGKAIPLQAWVDPDDSRRMRLADFKIVST
jgi:hypothetical protein